MRNKCYHFFETLGTKLKIDVVFELKERPLGVNELSKKLKQERSKVSHALISLLNCGFVDAKKRWQKKEFIL